MKNKIIFLLLFSVLAFFLLQIPVNYLEGSRVKFTLFDLFAPVAGAFLGTVPGVIAVISASFINLAVHGFPGVQQDSILKLVATLRFLPLLAGVIYFSHSKKLGKFVIAIPILSMIIFNLHPVGRSVWYYSLFWLIPVIIYFLRERFLLARALGSTFTAHAIGGAVWIWAFNMPASVWVSLIPLVILERSMFTLGISAFYILLNNVMAILAKNKHAAKIISPDKRYLLPLLK